MLAAEAPTLPPPAVLHDLAALLRGRPLPPAPMPEADARLRRAVARYEDVFLGKLVADARLEAAGEALFSLPEARRGEGLALLVDHILRRVRFGAGVAVSAAVVRRLAERSQPPGGAAAALLAEGYQGLAAAARPIATLLSDGDVSLLRHLPLLSDRPRRLAAAQIAEAAALLEPSLPRRPPRRPAPGPVGSELSDEGAYPAGGYAALAPSGSPESLVPSELLFLEDAALFEVRWAEGELLHYTRDEGLLRRAPREIRFVVAGLARARVKERGQPFQRGILALGGLLAAIRRLRGWLGGEGLTVRVQLPGDAAEERDVMRLLLGGMAALDDGPPRPRETVVAIDPERADWAAVLAAATSPGHHGTG